MGNSVVISPVHGWWLTHFPCLQTAREITVDAKWVDKQANSQLDIVFVLDKSGSLGPQNYKRAKQWIRGFLDFFSVAPAYAQVSSHILFWFDLRALFDMDSLNKTWSLF